jgi:hypothetical protein
MVAPFIVDAIILGSMFAFVLAYIIADQSPR